MQCQYSHRLCNSSDDSKVCTENELCIPQEMLNDTFDTRCIDSSLMSTAIYPQPRGTCLENTPQGNVRECGGAWESTVQDFELFLARALSNAGADYTRVYVHSVKSKLGSGFPEVFFFRYFHGKICDGSVLAAIFCLNFSWAAIPDLCGVYAAASGPPPGQCSGDRSSGETLLFLWDTGSTRTCWFL
jgi:hypothetical protein